jgi:hypothetical protein
MTSSGVDYEARSAAMAERIVETERRGGTPRSRNAMRTGAVDLADALRRWELGDDSMLRQTRGEDLVRATEAWARDLRRRAPRAMAEVLGPAAVL